MIIEVQNEARMKAFGVELGKLLTGGENIELVGDVGAGKTTLTKGIAKGMDIDEDVQSPSFTISRLYESPRGIYLAHYDFYRLQDPGIMESELHETIQDSKTITIIEWAEIVAGVLPKDRLTITITPSAENEQTRRVNIEAMGPRSMRLQEQLT